MAIKEELKKEIDKIKENPYESYQSVLSRLIEEHNKNAAK